MLLRLAQSLEQMDLALEHLKLGDPANATFNQSAWGPGQEHPHAKKLPAAQGQDFGAKVKLAEALQILSAEEAGTIRIGHAFRNEVYHVGVQYEETRFHFKVASEVMARIEPPFVSWRSGAVLPERSKKYFTGAAYFPARPDDYVNACQALAQDVALLHPAHYVVVHEGAGEDPALPERLAVLIADALAEAHRLAEAVVEDIADLLALLVEHRPLVPGAVHREVDGQMARSSPRLRPTPGRAAGKPRPAAPSTPPNTASTASASTRPAATTARPASVRPTSITTASTDAS